MKILSTLKTIIIALLLIESLFLRSEIKTMKNMQLSNMLDAALILEKEIELHPQFRGLQVVKIDPNDPSKVVRQ